MLDRERDRDGLLVEADTSRDRSDEGTIGIREPGREIHLDARTGESGRSIRDESTGQQQDERDLHSTDTSTGGTHHPSHARTLLDRDALREVPRLIDVGSSQAS